LPPSVVTVGVMGRAVVAAARAPGTTDLLALSLDDAAQVTTRVPEPLAALVAPHGVLTVTTGRETIQLPLFVPG
jgi:hypothetical protein